MSESSDGQAVRSCPSTDQGKPDSPTTSNNSIMWYDSFYTYDVSRRIGALPSQDHVLVAFASRVKPVHAEHPWSLEPGGSDRVHELDGTSALTWRFID